MAIYHCSVKPVKRSDGRSAIAAAAYRCGMELVDQRTGVVHDYTRRSGVLSSEVVAPGGSRIDDRSALWNAAEAAENRKDSRTAREVVIALPDELDAGQRRALATRFAEGLADRYGVAVAVDLHAPDKGGDKRNWHAHLLMTTRQVTLSGEGIQLGEKSALEWSDTRRRKAGLGPAREEVEAIRSQWAEHCNRALELAGQAERVDHRSYARQGIELVPTRHLGPVASEMERKGKATAKGDENRAAAEQNRAVVELAELRYRRDRMLEDRARFAAIVAANEEQHQLDPAAIAQDKLIAEQAAAEQRRADEARAQREREAKMAALAAAAQARLAEQAAQRKAAEEAERKAQEQAAAANRERIAAGGWQPKAMTDHLIDHPHDRENLLADYLAQPVDTRHPGTRPGTLRDEILYAGQAKTDADAEGGRVKAERARVRKELAAERQRPVLRRLFNSRTKALETELDRLDRKFDALHRAYEAAVARLAKAKAALPKAEADHVAGVQDKRRARFAAVEAAVPERQKERDRAEALRQQQQEAPKRRQSHTRRGPGQPRGPKPGR